MSALVDAARVALSKCLAVQEDDYVLVVTDELHREIGQVFRDVAREMQAESMYLEYSSGSRHGEEPPIGVAEIMREMDVVLAITAGSISHTDARRRACKAGARIATLPGITPAILEHCLGPEVDVDGVAARVREVARAMQGRAEVHVTSEAGTDLRFSMEGSRIFQDTGMIRQPGDFGNLPAGKVSLGPVEGSARGDLVLDGSIFGELIGDEPLRLRIEGGRAVSVEGHGAEKLVALFEEHGEDARTLAEFGLGVHECAQLSGNPLEDEKVMGNAFVALGTNRSLGGTVEVPMHEVATIRSPKVTFDGRTLLEDGSLNL